MPPLPGGLEELLGHRRPDWIDRAASQITDDRAHREAIRAIIMNAMRAEIRRKRREEREREARVEFAYDLPVRARKACQRHGIDSIEKLAQFNPAEILKGQNVGLTTLFELRGLLQKSGKDSAHPLWAQCHRWTQDSPNSKRDRFPDGSGNRAKDSGKQ